MRLTMGLELLSSLTVVGTESDLPTPATCCAHPNAGKIVLERQCLVCHRTVSATVFFASLTFVPVISPTPRIVSALRDQASTCSENWLVPVAGLCTQSVPDLCGLLFGSLVKRSAYGKSV